MYSPKRRFRLFRSVSTGPSLLTFARSLAASTAGRDIAPTAAGPLVINTQRVGSYEYTARKASTTISSFTASDWFTNTKDTVSSWVIVNGDLTLNSGITFTPPTRKLFTVVYVTGNLTFTGTFSMSARGANHSGTGDSGGYTAPVDIRVATGTYNSVFNGVSGLQTNITIPGAGASGGAGRSTLGNGIAGTTGTYGQSGGGGGGFWSIGGSAVSGAGAAGTCFSGGSGGGAQYGSTGVAADGVANGGAGGAAGGGLPCGGGAGNPGGTGVNGSSFDGSTGTGGTLIIICEGVLNGTGGGAIVANGAAGGVASGADGGGSGGGSAILMYGVLSGLTTLTANGGGNGGGGTYARITL